MPAPAQSQIRIDSIQNWVIEPQILIQEIGAPGSTELPGILPCRELRMDQWAKMPPEQIASAHDITNLHLKLMPYSREELYKFSKDDARSYGQRCIDDCKTTRDSAGLKYSDFQGRSVLFIGLSDKQFFDHLDASTAAAGVTLNELTQLHNLFQQEGFTKRFQAAFLKIGRKVYAEMWSKGFSNRDITA